MKTMIFSVVTALAFSALVVGLPVLAAEPNKGAEPKAGEPKTDAQTTCMVMQGSAMTEEGGKAMREFMQSPKASQAMSNMMEMARKMGNGDLMLGMTKMMEMMGSMGSGMMGGQGGMVKPSPPAK